jgi:L-type amino acid transporter 9
MRAGLMLMNKKSFQALIANLMILQGDIESLIDFFSFTAWIFYG